MIYRYIKKNLIKIGSLGLFIIQIATPRLNDQTWTNCRSSQRRSSVKTVLLKFCKIHRKHLCQSLFLIKLQPWGNFLYRTPPVTASEIILLYFLSRSSALIINSGCLLRLYYKSGKVRSRLWSKKLLICGKNIHSRCLFLLNLSWRRSLSYRNQSIDLQSKSMDWFLYDNGPRHERVKVMWALTIIHHKGNKNSH